MLHFRGNQNIFQKYIHSKDESQVLKAFKDFCELSDDKKLPVLFLIRFKDEFYCGVIFEYRILLISPYGERYIEPIESVLKQLINASEDQSAHKLFISQNVMMSRRYDASNDNWSGVVCLELLELLAQDYDGLVKRMKTWEEITKSHPRNFMGLPYYLLQVNDIFTECALTAHFNNRKYLEWSDIVEIQHAQLKMLPILLYLHKKNTGELREIWNESDDLSSDRLISQVSSSEPVQLGQFASNSVPKQLELFRLIAQGTVDKISGYIDDNPGCLELINSQGAVALHEAVSYNDPTEIRLEIVKIILAQGVKLNAVMNNGSTACHLVTKATNATEVLEMLLSNYLSQFSPDEREKNIQELIALNPVIAGHNNINLSGLIQARDQLDMTSLHYALSCGNLDTAECLLIHGASLEAKDSIYNVTPLFLCFRIANVSIIEKALPLFLAYASSQQIKNALSDEDSDGNTLMHFACLHGSYRIVQTLVRLGARTDVKNFKDEMPIQWLIDPKNSESEKIIACISGLPIDETQVLLLPSYHRKNQERVLRRTHNIMAPQLSLRPGYVGSPVALTDSQNLGGGIDISTPTHFKQIVGVTTKFSADPQALYLEMDARFAELSSIVTKLFQVADSLTIADNNLFSRFHCNSLLAPYKNLVVSIGNPEIIYPMLTTSSKRLDNDNAHCLIVLNKVESLLKELTTTCHLLEGQKLILKASIVLGEMKDNELKLTFPTHNPSTLRLLAKDKSAYEMFTIGLSDLLTNNKNALNNYYAIKSIFMSLQKLIATIQSIQQLFKVRVNQNSQSMAGDVLRELKERVTAIMNRHRSEETAAESAVSVVQLNL